MDTFEALRDSADTWCEGRSALARAPLMLYLVYGGIRHLLNDQYRTWFAGITLGFHEAGHLLFSFFGNTMMFLGGSIMQLLVPFVAAVYLLKKQQDWFGFTVGGAWLSFSAWELGHYVYDAPRGRMPLVGFSGQPHHDWETLLTRWRLLNHADTFATIIYVFAFLTWLGSMALAGWLLWRMWQQREA